MDLQQIKYRLKRLKSMAPKEIVFVLMCFAVAIVLSVLLANGLL